MTLDEIVFKGQTDERTIEGNTRIAVATENDIIDHTSPNKMKDEKSSGNIGA